MTETTCTTCDRVFDTEEAVHYTRLEPAPNATTILHFRSASCVGENAGLFDE